MNNNISLIYNILHSSARSHIMKDLSKRRENLKNLKKSLIDNQNIIFAALQKDLNRPNFETFVLELAMIHEEINLALKNLHKWSKNKRVKTPLLMQPGYSYIEPVPKGLVLIISPWNYPFQLSLIPLISAIVAGNCAIVKPSELAHESAILLAKIVNGSLDSHCFRVINGDVDVAKILLDKPFDHIFYTGSTAIGKEVMKKAAVHLSSVTLELGGKSPCIVTDKVDLKLAVKRIIWAKFLNAGQTCIAPDYVLINHKQEQEFVKLAKEELTKMFGDNPKLSLSYSRIINTSHCERLINYLPFGKIEHGGSHDVKEKFIEPTLLTNIKINSPLMLEEIFGPLLPIISVAYLSEAIDFINNKPHPLALYIFSTDKKMVLQIKQKILCGGISINDCLSHAGIIGLPFGGVGASGMGSYHGKFGFDTFSHLRAVHVKSNFLDNPIKYAPFSEAKLKLAKLIIKC